MRNILIAIIMAISGLFATPAFCGDKIIARSEKKIPQWLATQPEGYIIVELERETMEEAQQAAISEIARRIITSVALNVSHSSKSSASEIRNGSSLESQELFYTDTEINSAYLPFIKGVALSRAEGIYWEKRERKESKDIYVVYSVLYPFPASELNDMCRNFETLDKKKNDELASLRQNIGLVDSTDAIDEATAALTSLHSYFFDKIRKNEAMDLKKRYLSLYKRISITGNVDRRKKEIVCLTELDGRPVKTSGRVSLKSGCASKLEAIPSSDGRSFKITYSDEDCLDWEENTIEITIKSNGGTFRKTFIIN